MALHGVPPMAKISESALQAAMRPKGKGSLTMGARISTDCTRAFPGGAVRTAASSLQAWPARRRRSRSGGSGRCASARRCSRAPGASLAAQPAAFARSMSPGMISPYPDPADPSVFPVILFFYIPWGEQGQASAPPCGPGGAWGILGGARIFPSKEYTCLF